MKLPEIIGIAGTNGSGKDTLANQREQIHETRTISLSGILRLEAAKRNMESGRSNLSEISTEYARRFGPDALAMVALADYWKAETATGLSVVSIRRPAEAQTIQDAGGLLFWIDARQSERYARIENRKQGRPDDAVSFEEFVAQEYVEMHPTRNDPTLLNMAAVRDMADIHLWNTFEEVEYSEFLRSHYDL